MSLLYFQLMGKNEFNCKIPMFVSKEAVINSQNLEDLFGISNNGQESTQSLQS